MEEEEEEDESIHPPHGRRHHHHKLSRNMISVMSAACDTSKKGPEELCWGVGGDTNWTNKVRFTFYTSLQKWTKLPGQS